MRGEIVRACGCPMDRADDVRLEMMRVGLDFSECTRREFDREAKAAWSRLQAMKAEADRLRGGM